MQMTTITKSKSVSFSFLSRPTDPVLLLIFYLQQEIKVEWPYCICCIFTPYAQRERGKVICRSWCPYSYICLWTKKIFESYFRDRLTFSNIRSRTSRRIYRLALPLRAPETLSSLSKSRISIFNAHLTLFVHRMTSQNSIGKYRHLVN